MWALMVFLPPMATLFVQTFGSVTGEGIWTNVIAIYWRCGRVMDCGMPLPFVTSTASHQRVLDTHTPTTFSLGPRDHSLLFVLSSWRWCSLAPPLRAGTRSAFILAIPRSYHLAAW